jgi:hypothetical protein
MDATMTNLTPKELIALLRLLPPEAERDEFQCTSGQQFAHELHRRGWYYVPDLARWCFIAAQEA